MRFQEIQAKVHAGEPLVFDDGVALFRHPNLLEVGQLANQARERLHGQRTYFNRNLHINVTNVCVASCRFCSFARLRPGDAGAYTMSLDEAWNRLRARLASGDRVTDPKPARCSPSRRRISSDGFAVRASCRDGVTCATSCYPQPLALAS